MPSPAMSGRSSIRTMAWGSSYCRGQDHHRWVTQERTRRWRGVLKLRFPSCTKGYDKLTVIREMAARHGFSLKQVAYIGDDVNDLEALKAVGFSASPADGLPAIVSAVDYVCQKKGGEGAVREIIEMILDAQQPRPR